MIDQKTKAQLCQQCPHRRNYLCTRHGDQWDRIVKQRSTCVGWGNAPAPIQNRAINNLAIVTCHFNPCGFEAPVRNYHEFRDALGVPLVTVEMSFTGEFEISDSIKIHADIEKNNMWQKEALLNVGIKSLPTDVDAVAWIDADVLFSNPNWYEETKQKLEASPVVQMFKNVDCLNADRSTYRSLRSWAATRGSGNDVAPGFAWAARRDVIKEGLYDLDIVGGGDCHMIACWIDDVRMIKDKYASFRFKKWDNNLERWRGVQYPRVMGKIGCVSGKIQHLYHGNWRSKQYVSRVGILNDNDFSQEDVRKNADGILEWSTDKPELRRQIAEYFLNRKEDVA